MRYPGRPGPSPVVAALLVSGVLARGDRVLDLGCGNGVDSVEMALHGLRVTGVDRDGRALAVARRRAQAAKVRVEFVRADATRLDEALPEAAFDAAVDTLLVNNLRGDEVTGYARGVAHALRDGGALVVSERVTRAMWRRADAPPDELRRWFRLGPSVPTQLPERPERDGAPGWANVVVTLCERKRR